MDKRKLRIDKKTGLLYRPECNDQLEIREAWRAYCNLSIGLEDVVLDCGAHIGGFTNWALQFTDHIVSYEPHPETFAVLELNCPTAELHQAALVVGNETSIDLWVTSGATLANNSTTQFRGRTRVAVPAACWVAVLSDHQPTIIKLDVEFAEYELLRQPLPDHVRQLSVELHLMGRDWRQQAREWLVPSLNEQFGAPVRAPVLSTKLWNTIGTWRR